MTSFLAHYGIAAVFVLMMVDAVFPAASELVMVYGGALASGALGHELDVFGSHVGGFGAYVAVVLAGNAVWCLVLAAIGWALGSSYHGFDDAFRYVEILIVAAAVLGAAWWLLRRRRSSTIAVRGDEAR